MYRCKNTCVFRKIAFLKNNDLAHWTFYRLVADILLSLNCLTKTGVFCRALFCPFLPFKVQRGMKISLPFRCWPHRRLECRWQRTSIATPSDNIRCTASFNFWKRVLSPKTGFLSAWVPLSYSPLELCFFLFPTRRVSCTFRPCIIDLRKGLVRELFAANATKHELKIGVDIRSRVCLIGTVCHQENFYWKASM